MGSRLLRRVARFAIFFVVAVVVVYAIGLWAGDPKASLVNVSLVLLFLFVVVFPCGFVVTGAMVLAGPALIIIISSLAHWLWTGRWNEWGK